MKKFVSNPKTLKIFLFGSLFIACYLISACFSRNSDLSIAAFMGQDMANGNVLLKGWFLSTTSFYFTDLIPHAVVSLFTKSFLSTAIITGTIIAFLLFYGAYLVLNSISKKDTNLPLFIGISMFLLYAVHNLVGNPCHIGTVAFCLFAIYFYFKQMKYSNVLFTLFTFMAIASDGYALVYLVLPILCENIIYFVQNKKLDKRVLYVFVAFLLSGLFKLIVSKYGYVLPGVSMKFVSKENFVENLSFIFWGPLDAFRYSFWGKNVGLDANLIFGILSVGFALSCMGVHIYYAVKHNKIDRIITTLLLSSMFVILGVTFVNLDRASRYFLGLIINGFILLNVLVSSIKIKKMYFMYILSAFVIVFVGGKIIQRYNTQSYIAKPEQQLVDFIQSNNLHNGLAAFWNSATFNLVLDEVKVMSVTESGHPYLWLTKQQWYGKPCDFILINKTVNAIGYKIQDKVIDKYGEIKNVFETHKYKIYVFKEPFNVENNKYYGIDLPTAIKRKELKTKAVETNADSKRGFLSYGPYKKLVPGKYTVIVKYSGKNIDKSWVDVYSYATNTVFDKQNLLNGQQEIKIDFETKKAINALEVRVFYAGEGKLHLDFIEIKPKG